MSIDTYVVIQQAGREFPGAQVHESQWSTFLAKLAEEHAWYMATYDRQGHQRWENRLKLIMKEFPEANPISIREICAESWSWQKDAKEKELWLEAFKCWKQSPGHWLVASNVFRYFGAWLAQSRRSGVWYMCVIVAG